MCTEEMVCCFSVELMRDTKDGEHLRLLEDFEDRRVKIQMSRSRGKDQREYLVPQF